MLGQKRTEPCCISLHGLCQVTKGRGCSSDKDESQGRVTFITEMGVGVGSQLDSAQVRFPCWQKSEPVVFLAGTSQVGGLWGGAGRGGALSTVL